MKRFTLGLVLSISLAWAGSYTVQPGDTLWSIAQKHGIAVESLILANNLQSSYLQAGQELTIPEVYTVAKDDTLWRLAKNYGTSVDEIKRLNRLQSNSLQVGQRLIIISEQQEQAVGLKAASLARSLLGKPYNYGGNGPDAFDCSGYVGFVYRQLGVELPRTAAAQWSSLSPANPAAPGDLVFFSFSGRSIDHVGIYLGEEQFAHANSHKNRVVIESLSLPWYKKAFRGIRRVTPAQNNRESARRQP